MCVCVRERNRESVCVRERNRECVCMCVCVCVCVWASLQLFAHTKYLYW